MSCKHEAKWGVEVWNVVERDWLINQEVCVVF